jgi:predicted DNA-binding protein YlxM (UPF0122 family)
MKIILIRGSENMNREQIAKIAGEAGAKAALEAWDKKYKEQKKSRHNKRLHNTKLLLKHYNILKDHCENSIDNLSQIVHDSKNENSIDILDSLEDCDTDIYIESIKRSVSRTYIIINHIENMLDLYESYCNKSSKPEDQRRYRVARSFYIEDLKADEIAKAEGIDKRTCYRDTTDACAKLSALIFGIDGLSTMTQTCP